MDDLTIIVLIVSFTIVIPLSLGLALWLIARQRRRSDAPLSHDGGGAVLVPVRQLKRAYRLFGFAENSMSPQLEIVDDGLRFKVFKPNHWPFTDIARVHFFSLSFVTRLEIRSWHDGRLYIDLANRARARDFLRALPSTLPLTPRAAALRDAGR